MDKTLHISFYANQSIQIFARQLKQIDYKKCSPSEHLKKCYMRGHANIQRKNKLFSFAIKVYPPDYIIPPTFDRCV